MSPSLCVSQVPPKPFQKAFPGVGPITTAPVALSNTSNVTLTHSTNWEAPTAPFVSGGTKGPPLATVSAALRPSKLRSTVACIGALEGICATGSPTGPTMTDPVDWAKDATCRDGGEETAEAARSRSGCERSCFTSCATEGLPANTEIGSAPITIPHNVTKNVPPNIRVIMVMSSLYPPYRRPECAQWSQTLSTDTPALQW